MWPFTDKKLEKAKDLWAKVSDKYVMTSERRQLRVDTYFMPSFNKNHGEFLAAGYIRFNMDTTKVSLCKDEEFYKWWTNPDFICISRIEDFENENELLLALQNSLNKLEKVFELWKEKVKHLFQCGLQPYLYFGSNDEINIEVTLSPGRLHEYCEDILREGDEGRSRADKEWLILSLDEYKRHAYEHFTHCCCSEDAVEHDWPKIQFDEYDQWYDRYGKDRLRKNDKNNECKVEIAAIKALIRKRNRDE